MALGSVHLRGAGVSVVVAPDAEGSPVLLHWGKDLGAETDVAALNAARRPGVSMSAFDHRRQCGLVPERSRGYTGTPALAGHRSVGGPHPRLSGWSVESDETTARFSAQDLEAGWGVSVVLELSSSGVLASRTEVTNLGETDLHLDAVHSVLPVGAHGAELLDLTGRWCKERTPQRHPFVQGTFRRDARHGRTGHDASVLLVAGTPGFTFGQGEVWGVHVAWSGNHTTYAERTPEGECLIGGGELLDSGEVVLQPGQAYLSPWLLGSWSESGLDQMSHRLHDWIRERSPRSRTERPVLINTWEAVYFDHDLDKLGELADAAREVGVERFVLDDGWFAGRRDDTRALGDWWVDPQVWPEGLTPLIDRVHDVGLQFGLWVEPEMISEDSQTARAHPDWILRGRDSRLPETWRHQQVIDLQNPAAYKHVRDALLALLDEYPITYLKWDHNRDLTDAQHEGRPAVHGQTLALYRLLDELRAAHPELEIESCASGGGRVDAEILTRTDRIWPSDTIDALERQTLQRWTSLLVPPELMGSHIGGPTAHTTGRSHRLGFRAATAVLYHLGVEWDLSRVDDRSRQEVAAWIGLHREIRPHITTGRLVHGDHPDPGVMVTGIVAPDRSTGWYVVATVAAPTTAHPAPVRMPGLDPDRTYHVVDRTPTADQHTFDLASWWATEGVTVSGAVLMHAGVSIPSTAPEVARVLQATAVTSR